MDLTININDPVKVRLTSYGVGILREKHETLNAAIVNSGGRGLLSFEVPLDAEGYYNTQLWCLMQAFGDHIRMGTDLPFEANIILKAVKIKDDNEFIRQELQRLADKYGEGNIRAAAAQWVKQVKAEEWGRNGGYDARRSQKG